MPWRGLEMIQTLPSLLPVFLLIALGYALRARGWIDPGFWGPAERLTYLVFFPALLFRNTAMAHGVGPDLAPLAVALTFGVLAVAAAVMVARSRLGLGGPSFTSVFQGAIRPNVYLAIAAAAALFGDRGMSLVSVGVAVVVPIVNLLAVLVLARYANPGGQPAGLGRVIGQVLRNPLILSCLAGGLLGLTGVGVPPLVDPILEILGRAALPLGLMAVGAGLDPRTLRGAGPAVLGTVGLKMLVVPALTWAACLVLGVAADTTAVCVIYAAMPTSASSYVLARQMGGDGPLLAGIVTAGTIASAAVVPLLMILLG
ncbi:MAG: AEC family transporter [Rhodobacterales bacterium]|nr:AEC family transporter [Rhodobacterales bacterium]